MGVVQFAIWLFTRGYHLQLGYSMGHLTYKGVWIWGNCSLPFLLWWEGTCWSVKLGSPWIFRDQNYQFRGNYSIDVETYENLWFFYRKLYLKMVGSSTSPKAPWALLLAVRCIAAIWPWRGRTGFSWDFHWILRHSRWCPSSLAKLVYNSNNYGLC
jgi:hypothetical protein